PLGTLRNVARKHGVLVGVSKKETLIENIVAVLTGKEKPAPPSKRGAPVKESFLDPSVLNTLSQIRREYDADVNEFQGGLEVSDGMPVINDEPIYSGILEIMQGGYGFLRAKNCQPTSGGDIFVSAPAIHANRLREGDFVACTAKCRQKNESPALDTILSVNGLPVGEYERRPFFDSLTAQYANEKIALSEQNTALSLRVLDLFVPIGKGQRALLIAPPKAGKTTLLKEIARSVANSDKDLALIVLLIDERPEEVTDFRLSVEGAQVVYSTFDEGAEHHVRAAELTLSHAKRMAELGHDVVILLDSLTKLTRAYNYLSESSGKTLSGGLEAGALSEP
ncbi:MAG: transcription termination factor Rho, partial [Clostridiales bacterium]|nr:transcription termination factor Rho [Clostridiales bacterium]